MSFLDVSLEVKLSDNSKFERVYVDRSRVITIKSYPHF